MKYDFRFAFYAMTIVAVGTIVSLFITASKASRAKQEAAKLSFDLLSAQSQARGLHAVVKHYEQCAAEQGSEYVDEANITGDFPNTEELGKAYPRIVIDGVKCDYDPAQKWFVHAELRCRVMWMEIGGDKMLMDRCDFRDHEGEPYTNTDGDILIEMQPLKIMENGKWRTLRDGDPIHRYAAVDLGLQKKGEEIGKGSYSRIGNTNRWTEFNGETWRLIDNTKLPDDVKASIGGSLDCRVRVPEAAPPAAHPVTVSEPNQEDSDTDAALLLAAVQAEYEEALSQYAAIGDQVREKSRELTALVKLKKLTEDNLTNLRKEVDRLTSEQNAADKAKQEPRLGEYSPDPDGVAAYGRDLQEWEKRNRQDVYAPGLVTPTGDR